MKKKTRLLLILAGAVLLAAALLLLLDPFGLFRQPVSGDELLQNAALTDVADNGLPAGWYTDAYVSTMGVTGFELLPDAGPEGQPALHIVNHGANDARFAQEVPVAPDSTYCLTALIRADGATGRGANLSISGVYVFSEPIYDTEGQWQRVTLYGKTGKDQHSLTVYARLGGYSGESTGEAWFADLSFHQVEALPDGAYANLFYTPQGSASGTSGGLHLDLRHVLIAFFLAVYVALAVQFLRAHSLVGMLALSLITAGLATFFALRTEVDPTTLVSQLAAPVPGLKVLVIAVHLLTVLMTLALAFFLARRNAAVGRLHKSAPEGGLPQTRRMDWKDWTLMLLITAAYAVVAYTGLGSTVSPQTNYAFTGADESVIFDLGQTREGFRMLYMGSVHQTKCDFTVEFSDDGVTWSEPITCEMNEGALYQWKYVRDYSRADSYGLKGRYVRLTAQHFGLTLAETLFRDAEGTPLPVTVTSSLGLDASALIDEPDTLHGQPSWFTNMYFDEIYHARTAYEHLHGIDPYEISHPPLGKVLMSWCIALFGMTPFGWRFAGATCGVLMLPAMYLLGRLLFRKRRYAVLPCLMMALDCMHFTQTRIATIDSFVVLFILWAVYFMFRWFFTDFFRTPLWRTMVPLGLSGMFMGLSIASKWPGCFAGLGLAAVFFYGLWRRLNTVLTARSLPEEERDERESIAADKGLKRILWTVASCFLFFVAVPLVIYYCAYIPYFAPTGGVTVKRVIEAAEYMLWYHSQPGHGMDHAYYTPWYQWPLSEKPMWYASKQFAPEGSTFSIMTMGNYAVWWVGFGALLAVVFAWCQHQLVPLCSRSYHQRPTPLAPAGERDIRPALLLISFAAQYIPWTLVPRGTYIYHYFPSVPFIILCTVYVLERLNEWAVDLAADAPPALTARRARRNDRLCLLAVIVYALIVLGFFVAFYPIASGVTVPTGWMNAINWFGTLHY